MNCPQCNAPMQEGELALKAWGIGLEPQARLFFDRDLILENQYLPLVGFISKGTRTSAFRCEACRPICFRYGDSGE
ncbi:MAG TPA: PF20097 family protein [Pirellulales bacterium]|nr:PF20097 family protein [Pirellulales bacterium]